MGVPLLLLVIGACLLLGVVILARLRQDRVRLAAQRPKSVVPVNLTENENAVLVAEGRGQLVFANEKARSWFGMNGGAPDLEVLTGSVEPADTFLELFGREGQASFRVGTRRISAASHFIPNTTASQMVIVMRELETKDRTDERRDPAHLVATVGSISSIVSAGKPLNETLTGILKCIGEVISFDAAEVNLWNDSLSALRAAARVGEIAAYEQFDLIDGLYRLDDSLSGWLAQFRQPLLVTAVQERPDLKPKLPDSPFTSFLGLPLTLGDRLLGTVELAGKERGAFDHEDMSFLQTVSGQIAIAVENARLSQTQTDRVVQLSGLQDLTGLLPLRDPRDILTQITNRIATLMNVEMCGVLSYLPEQNLLIGMPPFHGVPDAVASMYRIPVPEGTTAYNIFQNRDWWYSNDVGNDDLIRQIGLSDLAEAVGVNTTAFVPLFLDNKRFGSIQIANKRDNSAFTEAEMRILSSFATQIAAVVHNAQAYEEAHRRVDGAEGLAQISEAISVLREPSQLYGRIVKRVADLMNVEICGILLHDNERNMLVSQIPFYGVDDTLARYYQIPFSPDSKLAQRINRRGYWISNSVTTDTAVRDSGVDKMALLLSLRQTLIVPLTVGDERLGFIQVANHLNSGEFTEDDARTLNVFASQAAVIINNARAFRETRHRSGFADGLRRIADLASNSQTLDQLFSGVVREVKTLLNCDITSIGLLNETTGELRIQPDWTTGVDGQLTQTLILDAYAPGFDASPVISKRPFLSNDLLADGRVLPVYRALAERFRMIAAVQVPLIVRDRGLGELTVASRVEREFTTEDLRLLQAIALQTSIGIERIQIHRDSDSGVESRVQQLDALIRIGNEINQIADLDRIVEVIRAEAQRVNESNSVTMVLLAPADEWSTVQEPQISRRIGLSEEAADAGLLPIEREAVLKGQQVIVANYETSDLKPVPVQARSAIAAPIFYGDSAIGVLHLYSDKLNAFPAQMQEFIRVLSSQAAIGIGSALRQHQNAARSELIKQRAGQFSRIFELGKMLRSQDSADSILMAIASGITEVVGFNVCIINLVTKEAGLVVPVAHAGISAEEFALLQSAKRTISSIENLLIPRYRVSNSYVLPEEEQNYWMTSEHRNVENYFVEGTWRPHEGGGPEIWKPGDLYIVPLRSADGELVGLISVDEPRSGRRPTQSVIETLEIFADQAAAAVENYRLLQGFQNEAENARRERDRLERLYLVAGEIQRATDVPTRLKVVADSICAVGWGRVAITLRDHKLEPRETIMSGFSDEDEGLFRANALPGMVWSQRLSDPDFRRYRIGQAYYIRYSDPWVTENKRMAGAGEANAEALAPDPSYPADRWHPLDTLYLPLYGLDRSRMIGVITMDHPADGKVPTEASMRSIELFAAQAASAIENTRLYDETIRAANQEARINEVMEAVASTLDLDEIIQGIALGLRDMVAFTRMSVMMVDEERDEFSVRQVTMGMRGEVLVDEGDAIPADNTAVGVAVRDAKTAIYHISDANRTPSYGDLKNWWMTGERTSLIVPMIAGGRITGALHMGSELSGAFGFEEQTAMLSRMANLAAIAIENARLFQQTIDRERFSAAVGRIGQFVSASALLDKTSVLRSICEETVNLLGVAGTYVWLVQGDELVALTSHGLGADEFTGRRLLLNGDTFEAAVARERAPHMITNVEKPDSPYGQPEFTEMPVHAMLGVPLEEEEQTVGVLVCVKTDMRSRFVNDDIEKVLTLSVQAAIALENARLYADVNTRALQLSVLTDISGELAATLEPDAVVRLLIDRLESIIAFDRVTLWLRRGDLLVIQAARGFEDANNLIGVEAEIADSALFRDLASRGQVLNIPDISKDERFPYSESGPTRSWLGVSLVSRSILIGLLVLEKAEVSAYSPTTEQLALTFANQSAIALENARLFQEASRAAAENTRLYNEAASRARALDQQARRLGLLNQISNSLTQSPDTENIFDVTLREIVSFLNVERGNAILFEPARPQGRFVYEYPRGDNPPEETDLDVLFADDSPALEELRRTMQPLAIRDISTDSRVANVRIALLKRGVQSLVIVPMVIGGQLIGTLNFEVLETNRDFTSEQLEFTQTIAAQAVVAVQNANLFEQSLLRTRELETLFEATQATTSTLNLQEVLTNTAQQMILALQVDACQILMWDDVDDTLSVQIDMTAFSDSSYNDETGRKFDLTEHPTRERALKSRQMILTRAGDNTLTDAEQGVFQIRNVRARILLPLAVREQTIGLIEMETRDALREFTASDVRLARTLASQAAVAIDNARLNTETANKLEELFVINDISTSLASAIELEQIFEVVRNRLPALVKAQQWILAYLGEDKLTVSYPIAIRNGKPLSLPNHLLGDDDVSFVIKQRSPQRLAGEEIDEVLRNLKITRRILNVRCFLGVPLVSADEVVGALILGDDSSTRAFNLDVQRILSTVGAQIAVAIQNARLFTRTRQFTDELGQAVADRTRELQEERDRIQFLYRITTDLALSLDIEVVLKRALEMMVEAVEADMGAILGIDSLSDTLTYRATLNLPEKVMEPGTSLSQNEGLAGWVIQSQQSVIVGDVQNDPRWLRLTEFDNEPRSVMAVLLESNEDIYGVVMLYSRASNKFNDGQLRLVAAASNQVASAMNNAELYGLIREQAERLGMMVRREQVDSTKNLAIVESIADGVMVADPDGNIIQFNSAAERILGISRRDIITRPINELAGLYASSEGKSWLEEVERWILEPTAHQPGDNLSVQLDLDNGKFVQVILSPVNMGDQFLGTVSVIRDISREIEVDRMKSEFVATVSHELRTPMTSIKGYADLLLLGAAGPVNEQQGKFLSTIKTNADRLSVLVNELLDISRIDRGVVKLNFTPVDVSEVIEGAARHLRGRVQNEGKQMDISVEYPADLPTIRADFDKLTQIVNNLADNAFNYTHAGGAIQISAVADKDSAVIRVKDTGIGIPKEKQDRIWVRFFRDEEQPLVMETSGTGLGLAIVKEYVTMHGGDIWLESEPDQGTTFFVRIPAWVPSE
ncbi:MAG: GAF domain-containing protein [Anaerolineae bacterium]|nr:GAF domain-containing protein [Anaerolineae bacterium]